MAHRFGSMLSRFQFERGYRLSNNATYIESVYCAFTTFTNMNRMLELTWTWNKTISQIVWTFTIIICIRFLGFRTRNLSICSYSLHAVVIVFQRFNISDAYTGLRKSQIEAWWKVSNQCCITISLMLKHLHFWQTGLEYYGLCCPKASYNGRNPLCK